MTEVIKRIEFTYVEAQAFIRSAYDYVAANPWNPAEPWVTATDLHRRVRAAAVEKLLNLEHGSQGLDAWRAPVRVSISLQDCRSWLLRQTWLRGDNAGKGHVSGMRFRPKDDPLTAAEEATRAAKAKEKERADLVHVKGADGRPVCLPAKKSRKALSFSRSRPKFYCFARTAEEAVANGYRADQVRVASCPRCLKKTAG